MAKPHRSADSPAGPRLIHGWLTASQSTTALLEAIAALWEREREGPEEDFDLSSEVFAVDGDRAVVRAEVRYGKSGREFRDIWLLRFEDGRCREFEEWAFWPEKPYTPPRQP